MTLVRAALGTGFLFAMTTLGAATVFFFVKEPEPRFQKALLGFAAGIMTAASVWSLLLPAIAQGEALGFPGWIPACAGMLAGCAFLAALDALLARLGDGETRDGTARDGPLCGTAQTRLLITAITLHNIPEGMAVGLACAMAGSGSGAAGAAALAFGIGVQNFPEGAAVSLPLRRAGRLRAFLYGTASGAVEPVFGLLAACAAGTAAVMPWLLSFAAGAMLYVTAEELIPQAHSRAGTCGYLAGFLLMMALDTALG